MQAEKEQEKEKDDEKSIRRVIVATHTISLQEQLMHKDLPLLAEVMPVEVHGRAGQGPQQLPEPAAAANGAGAGRQPVSTISRSSSSSAP